MDMYAVQLFNSCKNNRTTKYISATHAQLEWGHSRCSYIPLATAKTITRFENTLFCGSEPARETGDAIFLANPSDAFASRLAPTADWRRHRSRHQTDRLPPRTPLIRPSRLARNTSPVLDREQSIYRVSTKSRVIADQTAAAAFPADGSRSGERRTPDNLWCKAGQLAPEPRCTPALYGRSIHRSGR